MNSSCPGLKRLWTVTLPSFESSGTTCPKTNHPIVPSQKTYLYNLLLADAANPYIEKVLLYKR
jgi:hypothetical protein